MSSLIRSTLPLVWKPMWTYIWTNDFDIIIPFEQIYDNLLKPWIIVGWINPESGLYYTHYGAHKGLCLYEQGVALL